MRLSEHPDFQQAIVQAAENHHDRGRVPFVAIVTNVGGRIIAVEHAATPRHAASMGRDEVLCNLFVSRSCVVFG